MSIYTKLLEVQALGLSVAKDASNPHFKSKYMDLDSILETYCPILSEKKLLIVHHSQGSTLTTEIIDAEDDSKISSEFSILNTDPQKRGAEITYGRRYNLLQLLNITAEDDDGNTASGANFKSEQDDKPWFSQANLEALAKQMDKFPSADECLKVAREKYKVSNKAKDAILHAYNTGTISKI